MRRLSAVLLAATFVSCGPASRVAPDAIPFAPDARVLVGAGDIAGCESSGDEETAKMLDRFSDAIVFTAGDNAYPAGTLREYRDCYDPSWGRHKARTRPVTGNHEYRSQGAKGHFEYWGAAAGENGWYSFDENGWHVVVLNSNCSAVGGCGEGSPQLQWLRADLAASSARCTMAIWHHPRFSSGRPEEAVKPFWDALQQHGAELVINAHDHFYERFAPVNGIRQIIVGTGGRNLYAFEHAAPANSEVRNADTHGVLALGLSPAGYTWAFVPVAGKTFTDKGSGTCK